MVPGPITNNLLISVAPASFGDIMRMIQELDAQPPQVSIQVCVAQVDLTNTEEFGVELGLQSPVLFQRSVIPPPNFFGPNGVVNFAAAATGTTLVPTAGSLNNSINPVALTP